MVSEADVADDLPVRPSSSKGAWEIALLRDVRRTAEVGARTELTLYALDREVFVPAVSGYRPAAATADAVVASKLDTFRPRGIGL